jgi:ribA/ribD-fused uncharacterized protein
LPQSLNPKKICSTVTDDLVLFWGKDSPLSNHNTEFSFNIDGKKFNSSEQFFCYQKAVFFNDEVAKQQILSKQDPVAQKKVHITGFNDKEWATVAETNMKLGILNRFKQNDILRDYLKTTGKRIIAEANPYDTTWGIGMRAADANTGNMNKWGANRLGKLLMEVRHELGEV